MKSDVFFSTYTLQPWDLGPLQGPFPRTETMCIMQSSACPPDEPSCLGPVSLEQIACDDAKCLNGSCTRLSILVDQTDTIVNQRPITVPPVLPLVMVPSDNGEVTMDKEGPDEGHNELPDMTHAEGNDNRGMIAPDILKPLGCFTETGGWTADRSQCAANQKPYVQPSVLGNDVREQQPEQLIQPKIIEDAIEAQFIPDARKAALIQNLLSSTVEAGGRISSILENPDLPDAIRMKLEQQQEALRTVQHTASEPDQQSVRDLQHLADTVAIQLSSVQEATAAWHTETIAPPLSVMDKLDRIFTALPSIFGLLLQEKIPVESPVMDNYFSAQQIYDPLRSACMTSAETCGDLIQAINALEPVFATIRLSLEKAERNDLEQQIDLFLQQ